MSHLWDAKTRIGDCGDWCIGHRVEDAFVSGLELALASLAIVGAIIGFAVAGTSGLWSALVAILLAAVFIAWLGGDHDGPAGPRK